jgi:riboflavin kinase/FMN adenylyltransferase
LIVTWGIENIQNVHATLATLGSYDGIHLGHIKIIERLLEIKKESEFSRSLLITFHPHPQEILKRNNTSIKLLTSIEERLELLEKTGIDEVLVIEFSHEFSKITYDHFFRDFLVKQIGIGGMVVGFNHAFGKNREGDIDHLRLLTSGTNILVEEVPPFLVDGISISSTKIRHAIEEGKIEAANSYLGRRYSVSGIVEKGDALGKELGYPTANVSFIDNKLLPADGVYSGFVEFGGRTYSSAISIGTRPTIESNGQKKLEAFILDFDGNLYGKSLKVEFERFLREQVKFESLEELQKQITFDVANVRSRVSID